MSHNFYIWGYLKTLIGVEKIESDALMWEAVTDAYSTVIS